MEKKFALCLAIVLVSLGSALAQSDYVKAVEKWRSDEETESQEGGRVADAGGVVLAEGWREHRRHRPAVRCAADG